MYADDTICLKKISSVNDCSFLQEDLNQLTAWSLNKWNLHFNKQKCVLLRFCSNHPGILFDYVINNFPIQPLNSHRDLGIIISEDIKWNSHLKTSLPTEFWSASTVILLCPKHLCKNNLYLSLVRSQLSYSSQV